MTAWIRCVAVRSWVRRAIFALAVVSGYGQAIHSVAGGAPSWPNWRGPYCNGSAVDCDDPLVDDITEATELWRSREVVPDSSGVNKDSSVHVSGFCDVIVAEGRAYLYWFVPSCTETGRNNAAARTLADDVVVAWDAMDGRTLWRTGFVGKGMNFGPREVSRGVYSPQLVTCYEPPQNGAKSGTIYAFSAGGRIYALQASDGKPLWESHVGPRFETLCMRLTDAVRHPEDGAVGMSWEKRPVFLLATGHGPETGRLGYGRSSGVVADGVLAFPDFEDARARGGAPGDKVCNLAGIDCRNGRRLWRVAGVSSSLAGMPMRWSHGGKEYLISVTAGRGVCIEPRTGKVLWEIGGDLCVDTYPAVCGDILVTTGRGIFHARNAKDETVTAWRMGPDGAQRLWSAPPDVRHDTFCGPVIHADRVYWTSKGRVVCADLATGRILANVPCAGWDAASIATDGRVIAGNVMFCADPRAMAGAGTLGEKELSPALAEWTSSTVCDGRLYYRSNDRVLCWDLRKRPQTPAVGRRAIPPVDDARAAVEALSAVDLETRDMGKRWLSDHRAQAVEVLSDLTAAATSDDWQRSRAACAVLSVLGTDGVAAAPDLARAAVRSVKQGDSARAESLTALLAGLAPGDDADLNEQIVAALRSSNEDAVRAACRAVTRMDGIGTNTLAEMQRLVIQQDTMFAAWTAEALRVQGAKVATVAPALVWSILADPKSDKVLMAAKVLDGIGKGAEPVTAQLVDAYVASEGPTRYWISETLTSIGPGALTGLVGRVESVLAGPTDGSQHGGEYRLNLMVDTIKTARNFRSTEGTVKNFVLTVAETLKREGGRIRSEYAAESISAMNRR